MIQGCLALAAMALGIPGLLLSRSHGLTWRTAGIGMQVLCGGCVLALCAMDHRIPLVILLAVYVFAGAISFVNYVLLLQGMHSRKGDQ